MATDTTVSELIINKLTKAQYDAIQNPSDTELYLVPDEEIPNSTIITNDGSDGDSVAIKLTDNGSYQRTFRIDTTGVYTGGATIQRIGSLIVECYYQASSDFAHGYYYGDEMSDLLTEVAVYQDDYDQDTFYLMLKHNSSLDSITFAITPLDGGDANAFVTDAAVDHTKVGDANITKVDALGKIGVISQTQTWSGTGSNPRSYTIDPASIVRGIIPQANIDLFESAGAVFNATSGYFELNGLTDISYEEMKVIYWLPVLSQEMSTRYLSTKIRTTLSQMGRADASNGGAQFVMGNSFNTSSIEVVSLVYSHNSGVRCKGMGNTFLRAYNLRKILDVLHLELDNPYMSNDFGQCYSLEYVHIKSNGKDILLPDSSLLAEESLLYMINNAGTATITITLHATAYARAIADADVQAALQSKTNVSLASA